MLVTSKTQSLGNSYDGDYQAYLVTLSVELSSKNPTFAELKRAVRSIQSYLADNIFLHRPYSDYDCTGAAFTSSLEQVYRTQFYTTVTYVYEHRIALDV